MVNIINRYNRHLHQPLLHRMHADRKRVFVDTLKWDVPHEGGIERDQFDDDLAEYLVIQDAENGSHVASLRLLRTDRPHILGNIFPELCDGRVPRGTDIREITRLCLSPGHRASVRLAARNRLARALIEYGLMTGIRAYTGVAEIGWFTQILSAGWDCRPLGLPKEISRSVLAALKIEVNSHALAQLQGSWRCQEDAPLILRHQLALAA